MKKQISILFKIVFVILSLLMVVFFLLFLSSSFYAANRYPRDRVAASTDNLNEQTMCALRNESLIMAPQTSYRLMQVSLLGMILCLLQFFYSLFVFIVLVKNGYKKKRSP